MNTSILNEPPGLSRWNVSSQTTTGINPVARWVLFRCFFVSWIAITFSGCGPKPQPAKSETAATTPSITVVKLEKKAIKRTIEQPGTIYAFEETVLYSKIPGFVKTLGIDPNKDKNPAHDRLIDIGSKVKPGQLLAELNVPELEEEYKQKQALVRQSDAEIIQAKKALIAASAGIDSAKAFVTETKAGLTRVNALYERWQSEYTRVSKLVSSGVIDTQTRDETENQFKAAQAARSEALAKVLSAEAAVAKSEADQGKATADVSASEARLDVAKAEVLRINKMRDYTKLTAPYEGIVTRRTISTGDFVAAGGKQGVFVVARIDPVRVVVNVPEAEAGLVNVGQDVKLTLSGNPKTGKVTRTSWSLEPGSRTLRTEIDIPNADGSLRPGMYAYARMDIELPEGLALPTAAVGKINDEPVVYLVENGKAVRVVVQLNRGDAQFTQVKAYKRPDAKEWTPFAGTEAVASPVANVANGQSVP